MTTPTTRPTGAHRPRTVAVLLAVLAAVALSLVPGTASAAGTVTPLAECYTSAGNGSWDVILGYENSTGSSQSIPVGNYNYTNPSRNNSSLPTTFAAGTQHGVARINLTNAELSNGSSWTLAGNRVSLSSGMSPCTASQLPMLANGAAVVAMVLLAGVVGVIVLRRQRRVTTAPAAGRG
ncbi:hypothetical protein TEK04_02330 [Klenkia sp. LSe6-5]|uniref:Uncharacterized protein n=1 Tax=Klenkia sesuvii TaxID=3103137 RepID=A0ABU8DPD1_9ACTN